MPTWKIDPDNVQLGVLMGGGPVPCGLCGELIDNAAPIAGNKELGFIAHRGCFESRTKQSQDQHRMAHDLAIELITHIDAWLQEKGGPEVVWLQTLLESSEIVSSFWRRMGRDRGATKDDIKAIREMTSQCAKEIYGAMLQAHADEDEDSAPEDVEGSQELPHGPLDIDTSVRLGQMFQTLTKPQGKGEA